MSQDEKVRKRIRPPERKQEFQHRQISTLFARLAPFTHTQVSRLEEMSAFSFLLFSNPLKTFSTFLPTHTFGFKVS